MALLFADLGGLRKSGSLNVVVVRVGRPVFVGALGFSVGTPKSSSPKESESESELRTTWSPRDSTRLLAPEAEETCEVLGGRLWSDAMTDSVVGVSSIVEEVEPKDMEGATAEGCVLSDRAGSVDASGRTTLSVLVFAGAGAGAGAGRDQPEAAIARMDMYGRRGAVPGELSCEVRGTPLKK